jgi:hypothetical protein
MPVKMDRDRFSVDNSDEWWFQRLFEAFFVRSERRGVTKNRVEWAGYLWGWYIGDPELPDHQTQWQAQITKDVLRMGRANLAHLAVESKLDRVQLRGFRAVNEDEPDPDDDDDADGPDAAARKLMAKYGTVYDDAALYASVMNDGYIWVGGKGKDGLPVVTAEDPRNCVTIDDPTDPSVALVAMKLYHDPIRGFDYAHVVLPPKDDYVDPETNEQLTLGTRVRVARRKTSIGRLSHRFSAASWEWDDDNKSGEYPAVAQGRGTLVHHVTAPNGVGDIEPHIDVLTRINNMIVDRLWISKFQVFRQRAFQDTNTDPDAGDPFPEEDEKGKKIDWDKELQADPGAMWKLPQGVEIWESTPTDLQGALLSVRDDIKEFASASRTPMYVFVPDAVTGSAEGAALADRTAVGKAEKWQKRMQRPFIAASLDMLAVAGHEVDEIELVWGPAKKESVNAQTTAAAQAKTAGVPQQGVWEKYLQADPEEVRRWRRMRNKDLLFQAPGETPQRPPDQVAPPAAAPADLPPAGSAQSDPVEDFANRPPQPAGPPRTARPRRGATV